MRAEAFEREPSSYTLSYGLDMIWLLVTGYGYNEGRSCGQEDGHQQRSVCANTADEGVCTGKSSLTQEHPVVQCLQQILKNYCQLVLCEHCCYKATIWYDRLSM